MSRDRTSNIDDLLSRISLCPFPIIDLSIIELDYEAIVLKFEKIDTNTNTLLTSLLGAESVLKWKNKRRENKINAMYGELYDKLTNKLVKLQNSCNSGMQYLKLLVEILNSSCISTSALTAINNSTDSVATISPISHIFEIEQRITECHDRLEHIEAEMTECYGCYNRIESELNIIRITIDFNEVSYLPRKHVLSFIVESLYILFMLYI